MAEWNDGVPPDPVGATWLRLEKIDEHGDLVRRTVLAVFVYGDWCESGDWRGESYLDPLDEAIIGWMPFHIPSAH